MSFDLFILVLISVGMVCFTAVRIAEIMKGD